MNAKHDAEEALRASEERFRALTQISSDWFWETDSEHRFTFLSLEVSLDYGTKRADILGKTRWELFPNALTTQEWEVHKRALAEQRPFQGVVTRTFDPQTGKVRGFFSISGVPMHDGSGKFVGYRGIGRDITRIKLTEQEIAESEARFRLITQNMRDIIVLMRPDGRTIYLSPSFIHVTGHDIEGSLREEVASFFHPDDFVWLQEDFARCAAGNGRQATLTYRFRHAAGH